MPKRRKPPAPKAGFIKDIIAGQTPRQAVQANLAPRQIEAKPFNKAETRELNQHVITAAADRAMRDESVSYALLDRLRQYQATWADLEVGMRAVMAKHLSGVGLEELDLCQREQFAAAAARSVMQALAKNPEAFADSARKEDQARESLADLARRFLGEKQPEALPPPSEAPQPTQGEPS